MTSSGEQNQPVALVTGATGGVGGAVIDRFIADGWRVAAGARRPIRQTGEAALPLSLDVTSRGSCSAAIAATVDRFGKLDLLVNCAGVIRKGFPTDLSEADWDLVIDVNLKGPFLMSIAAIPHLMDSGGSIVNVASDAGLIGLVDHSIYCASKGGLVLMTKAMALDLAPHGVRVNAVCPCNIVTPMLWYEAETSDAESPEAYLEEQRLGQPQGESSRLLKPEEVAGLVSFLAGEEAAAITGAALSIDFGSTAGLV
jgi:NAD(P)-dependent dehydrogenase (short-subunit alcohol dehydrogenase family)